MVANEVMILDPPMPYCDSECVSLSQECHGWVGVRSVSLGFGKYMNISQSQAGRAKL